MKNIKPSRFIVNLLSVYSANAINGVLGIIAVPLVIAALGNEQYGIYSIYMILASYVALIDCGVTKHFVRLMSSVRTEDGKVEYLQKAFGWYLVLAVILICILPILIYVVQEYLFPVPDCFIPAVRWIVILSVLEYILAIPIMLIQAYTLSNQKFTRYSNFIAISGFFKYSLLFLAAWIYRDPAVVVLFLVSRRLFDLIMACLILPTLPKTAWKPRVKPREFIAILSNSSVMSLAQFLQATIVSIGAVFVNRHFGIAVLGNYRVAFDLVSKVWFFSNGIGLVVFPKFSHMLSSKTEREQLYKIIRIWLKKSWTGYLLISIIAILCAQWLLPLFKLEDKQIILFFKLLIVGLCLNAHTNVSYEYLLADNRYGMVAFLSLAVLAIMCSGYMLLVDIAGPYAIGWAWIISQSIYGIVVDELVLKNELTTLISRCRELFVKIIVLVMTMLCLFAELYLGPIHIFYIAPIALIAGSYILMKDIKEFRLFKHF